MASLQEAWGIPGPAPGQGTGRLVGQNFYTGQNRNLDPNMMPYLNGSGVSEGQAIQDQRAAMQQRQQAEMDAPRENWSNPPPNISVKVEKSEEERELFRYMRSRLGEMDLDRIMTHFKNKCKRKVRRAGRSCGCDGFSEHMEECKDCRSVCNKKSEFRANLTLYLLGAVIVLLALNLFLPRKVAVAPILGKK